MSDQTKQQFILPDSLISPSDLSKTIRELEGIDNFLRQAKVRTPGNPVTLPKTNQVLEDIAQTNKLSLLQKQHREWLTQELNKLVNNPHKVHISFASTPSVSFLREIAVWLRQNICPTMVVEVGLQPSIAAGCVIRTTNKVFDLSLRNRFKLNREMLSKSLEQTVER